MLPRPNTVVGSLHPVREFEALRAEFHLPDGFSAMVLADAEAAAIDPWLKGGEHLDATALPLVTIDPPGAKDLDQAMLVERVGAKFRLHYAIADLTSFIRPGGPLDVEARRRGKTVYLPDGNVPLHPPVLSEGAASLLPGEKRPAVLWTIETDAEGEPISVVVRRAFVRSVAQFDYETVNAAFRAGNIHPSIAALPELGRLRRQQAIQRGAVELALPEQEISLGPSGNWLLAARLRNDVDLWNAEMSLLVGMAAARIMVEAKIGVLRVLPDPGPDGVRWLRRSARTLGLKWSTKITLSELLARLDATRPKALAFYVDVTRLLRGAGYVSFVGEVPALTTHAGIGGLYAHVTAPIRRLVDRFAAEVCLAVTQDVAVPHWVQEALGELPELMSAADALTSRVDRACLDQVEAWTLAGRLGELFNAVILRASDTRAEIIIEDPPVMARCHGENLSEGKRIAVRLTHVDVTSRTVIFEPASGSASDLASAPAEGPSTARR